MPVKSYRYNYYQSGDSIVVSFIGLKGVPQDGIIVDIQSTILHVIIHTPEFDPYDISLELYKPVDPALSTYQLFPSKVEIKLHKVIPENWPALERMTEEVLPAPSAPSTTTPGTLAFDTSNWDKFCEENKEEVDTSGDNLFKVLYQDATPEQKRAIMKSLQQSHGKTFNMNWDEVKDNSYDEA